MDILGTLQDLAMSSGFAAITWQQAVMILVSCVLLYMAIVKQFEPMLLLPIAFGMLLANLPLSGVMEEGGVLYYIYTGVKTTIFPCLIFLGIGAMTDFGPLLANPSSLLLGAAAQAGIYCAFILAVVIGIFFPQVAFTAKEIASIAIIGGADGPTAIYLTSQLAPHLLAPISVAAYSYMALIPLIQPPIMKALTTEKERTIVMKELRTVSQTEKIIFPIAVTIICVLAIPSVAPLIGMLMLGNLFRESGVVGRLSDTAQNALINIVTIMLGTCVGATAKGEVFLMPQTLAIIALGLTAFAFSTAGGVIFGKIMCKITGGKINPLIGAAGVSAVPMRSIKGHSSPKLSFSIVICLVMQCAVVVHCIGLTEFMILYPFCLFSHQCSLTITRRMHYMNTSYNNWV